MRKSYLRDVLSRSWSESWELVTGNKAITFVIGLLAMLLGILLKRCVLHQEAMGALTDLLFGALALALFWSVFFLFHACYLTPKRMIEAEEQKTSDESARADRIEKDLKSKIEHLEDRLKSRITVRCGNDVEGCIVKDDRGVWYRARLDMTGANVSGVETTITGIWENGAKVNLYGENLDVQMCEKEAKGQTVTMREGRPEYINLLFVAYEADKPPVLRLKSYPLPLGERAYFKINHEYRMSMVITCDSTHPSVPFNVKMKFKSRDELEEFQLV
jgi:hypothetical protein